DMVHHDLSLDMCWCHELSFVAGVFLKEMHREKVLKNIFLALGQEAQLCLPRFQQRRTDTRHVEWVCRLWAACQGK
ncbi:hypothetical protein KUCAC02_029305, partial [Chaenocephalus aceratus]